MIRSRSIRLALLSLSAFAVSPAVFPPMAAGDELDREGDDRGRTSRIDSFRPLSYFLIPEDGSVEIVAATPDGRTLFYADPTRAKVGIVDLDNPKKPVLRTEVALDGGPTSVASSPDGRFAIAGVNTSVFEEDAPPEINPGQLAFLKTRDGSLAGTVAIGAGPDAVTAAVIGGRTVVAVAIENEPIVVDSATGNLIGVGDPVSDPLTEMDVSGKGLVQIVIVDRASIPTSQVIDIEFDEADLTAAGLHNPADPQPEFVSIRGTKLAVTLQDNNGVAIIDLADPAAPVIERIFSTGAVAGRLADLKRDQVISFTQNYPADVPATSSSKPLAGFRMPDAIVWNAAGSALFTADEGEFNFTGGRGWSSWSSEGVHLWDDGGSLEAEAVARGHYPELRSASRGIEIEGVATAVFGKKEFAFVGSERGGFLAVYDLSNPASPGFIQLLATGWRPEGIAPIPRRGLLVTADEGPDEGSGSLTIFEGVRGLFAPSPRRPVLESTGPDDPWSALSGLAADLRDARVLYSVPDNALVSSIFRIDLQGATARIGEHVPVTLIGGARARYDLEGLAVDASIEAPAANRGFWLAVEGNAQFGQKSYLPNLLVQVDGGGQVLQEIRLPGSVDPSMPLVPPDTADLKVRNNGFEGVCVSASGRYLLACIQREFLNEPANGGRFHTRIARFDLRTDTWEFFLYPLDMTAIADDWIGLSEIIQLGFDRFAVIERDKQLGALAEIKKVYSFSLRGVAPTAGPVSAGDDLSGRVIRKSLLSDVLDEFTPFEKVEGLALTRSRTLWAVLDNDGGQIESRLVNLGGVGLGTIFHGGDDDDD